MYSTKELRDRVDWLEMQITNAALRGTDLVPKDEDLALIECYARELYDLSDGKNEVVFDRLGRPNIVVNIWCDEKAALSYLSGGSNKYFDVPSYAAGIPERSIHPAFIVDGQAVRGIRVGKYKDVRVNGKNHHVSLFGLPPAYGTGGFTESYDGLAAECDRINAGTYEEGIHVGNITRAIFSYFSLLSVTEGFACRGADNYTKSWQKPDEAGDPCGYLYNGQFIHVLTGSGPNSWRHDGTPFGIWGFRGPTLEILHGYITEGGVILTTENNDAAEMTAAELNTASSQLYKATLMDGTRVGRDSQAEGETAKMCYDYTADPGEVSAAKTFVLANSFEHQQTNGNPYGYVQTANMGAREGVSIPLLFRLLLIAPLKEGTPAGYTYMRNTADLIRVAIAGARWYNPSVGGFGCFIGHAWSPSYSGNNGSGRVVSIIR